MRELALSMDGLNPPQRRAVEHVDGPLIVLAGPGSGKTRVIAHRVANLIAGHGVPAHAVLAVTFTNKAAEEMQRRVESFLGGPGPMTCTFHRFCARMLRQFGGQVGVEPGFTIVDQDDRLHTISKIVKEMGLDSTHFSPRRIEQRISQLKNEMIVAEEYAAGAHDFFSQIVADVYPKYEERLQAQNGVDFDDLLLKTALLVSSHEDVRRRLDARFRYVLVDEYQDTNLAQYRIARALCQDFRNLCVTGDPDQSIYSWRGANPGNIFEFQRDYPDFEIVRLEENYRSTPPILRAADGLIRHNENRVHKDLHTAQVGGAPVVVMCHVGDDAEAQFIAESIREGVDSEGRKYRDFAVLLRTTALFARLETAFRSRHLPYQVVGGQSFFQRREVKDIVGYARLACNARDDSAFERVVNTPSRGVGETSIDRLRIVARNAKASMLSVCQDQALLGLTGIRGKQRVALSAFAELIAEAAAVAVGPPHLALQFIMERTHYRDSLTGDDEDVQDRLQNLDDMLHDAEQFASQEPEASLLDFLEMIGLTGAVDDRDGQADVATIMTLHAAKGLEFPVVFMPAFEQGVLPHERSISAGDVEEERRLAFVGLTRAREKLFISYTAARAFRGRIDMPIASQFLDELPSDALQREDIVRVTRRPSFQRDHDDFSQEPSYEEPAIQVRLKATAPSIADRYRQGMLVEHPRYGRGRITCLDGVGSDRKATIDFPSVGEKRFVLEKAPLELV